MGNKGEEMYEQLLAAAEKAKKDPDSGYQEVMDQLINKQMMVFGLEMMGNTMGHEHVAKVLLDKKPADGTYKEFKSLAKTKLFTLTEMLDFSQIRDDLDQTKMVLGKMSCVIADWQLQILKEGKGER